MHYSINNYYILQAVAIVDLPESNGEIAAAELKKEFGSDHVIFLIGDVAKTDELTGIVLVDC